MYIVNNVCSEGYFNGREVEVIYGSDKSDVINRAYAIYSRIFAEAYADDDLDPTEEFVTKAKFEEIMEKGFTNEDEYIVVQCLSCHYQFEPNRLDCI